MSQDVETGEDTDGGDGAPDRWSRDFDFNGRNDLMIDLGTFGAGTDSFFISLGSTV